MFHALLLAARIEGAALVLLVIALLLVRLVAQRQARRREATRQITQAALATHLVNQGSLAPVFTAWARLSDTAAAVAAASVSYRVAASATRTAFAEALHAEPWVARVLAGAVRREWWPRFRAARLLSLTATAADVPLVLELLRAPEPEIAFAATDAAVALGGSEIVAALLDQMGDRPAAVRRYQIHAVRGLWAEAGPLLHTRLTAPGAPAAARMAWLELAGDTAAAACLSAVIAATDDADAAVRLAATRAVGQYVHPRVAPTLLARVEDPDAEVRAAAVRGLGILADPTFVDLLAAMLDDDQYEVRLQAAIALATVGEPGRAMLRDRRAAGACAMSADAACVDDGVAAPRSVVARAGRMAAMVSGLSDDALIALRT